MLEGYDYPFPVQPPGAAKPGFVLRVRQRRNGEHERGDDEISHANNLHRENKPRAPVKS